MKLMKKIGAKIYFKIRNKFIIAVLSSSDEEKNGTKTNKALIRYTIELGFLGLLLGNDPDIVFNVDAINLDNYFTPEMARDQICYTVKTYSVDDLKSNPLYKCLINALNKNKWKYNEINNNIVEITDPNGVVYNSDTTETGLTDYIHWLMAQPD